MTSRYYGIHFYKNSRLRPKMFNKPMLSQNSTISKWRDLKSKLTLTNSRNLQNRLVLPQQIRTQLSLHERINQPCTNQHTQETYLRLLNGSCLCSRRCTCHTNGSISHLVTKPDTSKRTRKADT